MSVFQIISVCFGLFMLYVVRIHQKKKTLSTTESSFWYSVWMFYVIISLFPNLVRGLSNFLNFARIFDLGVIVTFMVLTIVTFFNYFRHKTLEHKLERLIRVTALSSAKKKQSDD